METNQIVVNRNAWQETYERSYAEAFRELVALGARPSEAAHALETAFLRGYEDGEDECSPAWLLAGASRLWRRPRWFERMLPGRRRAITRSRPETMGALLAAAGLAAPLLAVATMVADPMSAERERPISPVPIASPTTPAPTPWTRLSEASAWAAVGSLSRGVPVLRPIWLPDHDAERSAVDYRIAPASYAGEGYHVEYISLRRTGVGDLVLSIRLHAGPAEYVERSLIDARVSRQHEIVTVRGRPGELIGNGRPYWQVVWTEHNHRYAVEVFGFTREDLLRIAESLAVVDMTGLPEP